MLAGPVLATTRTSSAQRGARAAEYSQGDDHEFRRDQGQAGVGVPPAASHFVLDVEDTEDRHQALADGFERGELSLDAYLDHVVFYRERTFSRDAFSAFMRSRSQPHSASLGLIGRLAAGGLYRLATINNESREMNR